MEHIQLCIGEEHVKSLRVRIKGQTYKGDTVVGVCYRVMKRRKWIRPSTGNQNQSQNHGPQFMRGL